MFIIESLIALELAAMIDNVQLASIDREAKLSSLRATIHQAAKDKKISYPEWLSLIKRSSTTFR